MSRKLRSSKSTRATKRTKRRVMRKTSVRKAKKVVKKKGSRKKSKKSIVRKRKTSNNKNYMIMKGGDIKINFTDESNDPKSFNVTDQYFIKELTTKYKYYDGATFTNFTDGIIVDLKLLGSGSYSSVFEIVDSTDIKKKYIVKFTDLTKLSDVEVNYEINGRAIHKKLTDLHTEQNFVPKLKYYSVQSNDSVKELLITIEESSGEELFDYIAEKKKKINIVHLIKMAKCVQFLHNNNIVHRDIKLENFLIDENGQIKVIDFGFAISLEGKFNKRSDEAMTVLGSPSYIAPETAMGFIIKGINNNTVKEKYRKRDIYSLGRCIYFIYKHSNIEDNLKPKLTKLFRKCCDYKEKTIIPDYDSEVDKEGVFGDYNHTGNIYDIDTINDIISKRPNIKEVIKSLEKIEDDKYKSLFNKL